MSFFKYIFPFIIFTSFLYLSQCKSFSTCPKGTQNFNQYQLFFGQSDSSGNKVVGDIGWEIFLSQYISPRFPDGLTVYNAKGQWKNSSNQIIKEHSKVLFILLSPKDSKALLKIKKIEEEYKKRFQQESVLTLTNKVCAKF